MQEQENPERGHHASDKQSLLSRLLRREVLQHHRMVLQRECEVLNRRLDVTDHCVRIPSLHVEDHVTVG